MLIIISQIILLLVAVALPLRHRRSRLKRFRFKESYKIDTDTRYANYAINEFGSLEKISRVSSADQTPEMEN